MSNIAFSLLAASIYNKTELTKGKKSKLKLLWYPSKGLAKT